MCNVRVLSRPFEIFIEKLFRSYSIVKDERGLVTHCTADLRFLNLADVLEFHNYFFTQDQETDKNARK